jgi:hypothetical protein
MRSLAEMDSFHMELFRDVSRLLAGNGWVSRRFG